MGGRQKLNALHVKFALVMAGLAGITTGSWWVFIAALALAIGLAFHSRDIR